MTLLAYFDRINSDRVKRSLVKRLEKLGHTVLLRPAPLATWFYFRRNNSAKDRYAKQF